MEYLVAGLVSLLVLLCAWALVRVSSDRRESLPSRFREVTAKRRADAGDPAVRPSGEKWLLRIRGWATRQEFDGRSLAEIITGQEYAGPQLLLYQAGYRRPEHLRIFRLIRVLLPGGLLLLALAGAKAAGFDRGRMVVLAAAAALAGMILPSMFLRARARKRQEEITDTLPDALDLLTVCVEAGLGLSAALVRISDEFRISAPVLSEEIDVANREMVAGKPRMEALRSLAARSGVEEVRALVAMLVQTEKLGTSLAQSLRVHSDSLRTRRRQRAEEAAAKTTIKLVFPLVFLIFPALFIVILGPGVIQIVKVLFPVMTGK